MHIIQSIYPNEVIIGDGHFTSAKQIFRKTRIVTNFVKSGRKKIVEGVKVGKTLTEEQKKHNALVAKIRGRVESPYGYIKKKFKILNKVFWENDIQLECVVKYALAIHRLHMKK